MNDHAPVSGAAPVMIDNRDCQSSQTDLAADTALVVDAVLSAMLESADAIARHAASLSIVAITVAGLISALRADGALSADREREMWRFVSMSVGSFPEAMTAMADRQLSLMQQAAGFLPFDGDTSNDD